MEPPTDLTFITSNANKLAEVRSILAASHVNVDLSSQNVDVTEVQAGSVEEVTKAKAREAGRKLNAPVLVEDTALVFNAWGNLPGPYIKYFLAQFGPQNLHLLLAGFSDRSAQAICTFGYCAGGAPEGGDVLIFQGRTDGRIVEARGPGTFGWDSAFECGGRTYAEMTREEKNGVSHRGKALKELVGWLTGGGSR